MPHLFYQLQVILVFIYLSLLYAQSTGPVYSPYVTNTINGVVKVTQSPWTQIMEKMYSTVQAPKSGSVGLGSITGKVGFVKPKIYATNNIYKTSS